MIVSDKKIRTVEQSAPLDQMEYFIDQKNIVHITAMLRNMYSNPVKACIREYCANALDGHMQANKLTTPIEVTVPSALAPTFKVRDFGPGLNVEETKQLLCGFGSSGEHKRNSNNYIGGFGIGAKVGFAVSSTFVYTIWHEGKKRIWSNFLDEFDASKATLLSEEDSDEPTGIEVSVPVTTNQVDAFVNEIQKAFIWYPVMPILKGTALICEERPKYIVTSKLFINEQEVTIGLRQTNAGSAENRSLQYNYDHLETQIVMGHLAYPIEISKPTVGIIPADIELRDRLVLNRLTIEAPVGTVQLAPNREALQYSQRTKTLLNKLLTKILAEDYLQSLIKQHATPATELKDALVSVALYSDMFAVRSGTLLRELYPQYKHYTRRELTDTSKKPQYDLWLLPELTFSGMSSARYLSASLGLGCARSSGLWITGWTLQPDTYPEIGKFWKPDAKIFLVTGAEHKSAEWSLRRTIYIKNSSLKNYIGIIVVKETEKDATSKPYWSAVKDKIVEHIDIKDLESVTDKEVEAIDLLQRHRSRFRRSSGSVKRTEHCRKFTVLTANYEGSYGANSARWKALMAKNVTEESVWVVPMDGFLVNSTKTGVNFDGSLDTKNLGPASRDVTRWLQDTLLEDNMRREVLQNREIAGVRIKDYDSAVKRYELTSLWTRLKQYVNEIKDKFKLTNDHLALLYLIHAEQLRMPSPVLLNFASIKLLNFVFKHVSSDCEESHPLHKTADYWGPIFQKSYETATADKNSNLGIFRKFFVLVCEAWLSYTGGSYSAGCPLFSSPEDEEYWVTFNKIGSQRGGADAYGNDLRWRGHTDTEDPVTRTIQEVYANWPGLSAFLSGYSRGHAEQEIIKVNRGAWPLILGKEENTRTLPSNVKEHIVDYLKIKPLKRKVEKTW